MLSAAEEYELWLLLWWVNDSMLRARDNELKKLGLSTVQVAIIYTIKTIGNAPTQSELAR